MAQKQAQTATQYYIPSSQPKRPQAPTSPQKSVGGSGSGGSVTSQPTNKRFVNAWRNIRKTLRGQFLAHASLILLLSLVLAVMVSQAFSRTSDDLNTIGNGSIP